MDKLSILQQIFEVCIIPLLGILTAYIVQYIKAKSNELQATTDNAMADKYIALLTDTITKCVIATNQTYVDSLKNKDAFDKDAQKEAFQKTLDAVLAFLSDDIKIYINNTFGDVEAYITTQIEAAVNQNKTTIEK